MKKWIWALLSAIGGAIATIFISRRVNPVEPDDDMERLARGVDNGLGGVRDQLSRSGDGLDEIRAGLATSRDGVDQIRGGVLRGRAATRRIRQLMGRIPDSS